MKDDKILESLVRIHEKIDAQTTEINTVKVHVAGMKPRLNLVERVVYGAVGLILIAFMLSLSGGNSTKASAKQVNMVKKAISMPVVNRGPTNGSTERK